MRAAAIHVYDDLATLAEILPAWEELLAACPDASIFSTWEWLGSWWESFGGGRRLHVLAFSDSGGRLLALAPMAIGTESITFGIQLSVLHLMGDGSGDSDNLGFLVRPGFEADFAEALLEHLDAKDALWDIGRFNTMDPNARWTSHLRTALKKRRWAALTQSRPWIVVSLPDTWEAYLANLSGKERRKIGTRTRRLERRYEVEYRRCTDQSHLADYLDTLFTLHAKRWTARDLPGSFASDRRRSFYHKMGARFLQRGWLDLSQLVLDRNVVATQFSFRYRATAYSLQEGYDPACSADSVGYVLRAQNIKRLIADGASRYDFLAGRDQSKERWGAQVQRYVDLHFARRASLGALHLGGMHGAMKARGWLRKHLH